MNTVKIMSIIGIVFFTFCFLFIVLLININDYFSAAGWGVWSVFYGIPLSIVCLVQANKKVKIRKRELEEEEPPPIDAKTIEAFLEKERQRKRER